MVSRVKSRPEWTHLLTLLADAGLSGTMRGDRLQVRSPDGGLLGEARRCADLWWLSIEPSQEWCAYFSEEEIVTRASRLRDECRAAK